MVQLICIHIESGFIMADSNDWLAHIRSLIIIPSQLQHAGIDSVFHDISTFMAVEVDPLAVIHPAEA